VGVAKKILGLKKVEPVSTLYSDYAAIEVAESIHLHWRNTRIEFDAEEFERFGEMAVKAYLAWQNLGKVGSTRTEKMVFLKSVKLNERPSQLNPAISSDEARIEVQQWADYIHFHYKWMRMEFSFKEFVEIAELMSHSLEELKSAPWYESAPRRLGTNHRAVPKGRVDRKDSKEFWVTREDAHAGIAYDSYYLDEKDNQAKQDLKAARQDTLKAKPQARPLQPWALFRDREVARELVKFVTPKWLLTLYRRARGREASVA
jgi:hypothetical protein